MLKIETAAQSESEVVYRLTGRLDAEHLRELKSLLSDHGRQGCRVTLDLEGVLEVDRQAVRFFVKGAGRSAHLLHCPAYVK